MIGTLERESVNTVNVMTDRVGKRKKDYLAVRKVVVCPERSRLITESWKETEGESISVRWAKAFQKVLEGIPVVIKDGELIPVLGKNYLAYLNSLRIALDQVYKIGSATQTRVPTIREIIDAEGG